MTQDFIKITGLRIFAYHGVLAEEKKRGQEFYLNAKLFCDMRKSGNSDYLLDAVNYAECCQLMTKAFTEKNFDLIEAAGAHVCEALLTTFPSLEKVVLEVRKPDAPIGLPFTDVSVNMTRQWHKVYLSFGSNMGDKKRWIDCALQELAEHPKFRNMELSSLLTTKPYGPVEQDDFLNGCAGIETLLSPEELLALLHEIEARAGRTREVHWGPRTLDLDIIFYDKLVYESEDLILPHVDMANRRFVLQPLSELCPNYRHPILQKTVTQMLEALPE